jgi:hypothetical protein
VELVQQEVKELKELRVHLQTKDLKIIFNP